MAPQLRFKDLCLDATTGRAAEVAEFWSRVLEQEVVNHDDGSAHLLPPAGGPAERMVWVNEVPEPKQVKSRVHLDVRFAEAGHVPEGASVVLEPGDGHPWTVVADPDGIELCSFGPREGHPLGPYEVCVDSADPLAAVTWWAERFGVPVQSRQDVPWAWLEDVPGLPYAWWVFNPVPEPKTVKNRLHWDVTLDGASVDDLVAAGATLLRARDEEIGWDVLADPEGNEFCAFDPASP